MRTRFRTGTRAAMAKQTTIAAIGCVWGISIKAGMRAAVMNLPIGDQQIFHAVRSMT